MPQMNIRMDGTDFLKGFPVEKIVQIEEPITVLGLAGGMSSGAPSIAFVIDLPDGRKVFAQTSMKLLVQAADAFKAYYGDGRHRLMARGPNEN